MCLHTYKKRRKQKRRKEKAQKEEDRRRRSPDKCSFRRTGKSFSGKKKKSDRFVSTAIKAAIRGTRSVLIGILLTVFDLQNCQSNAIARENHGASHAPPRRREKLVATGWSNTSYKTSIADMSVELCTVQSAVLDKSRTRACAKPIAPLVVSFDKET